MSAARLDAFLADCEKLAEHFAKRGPLAGGVFRCGTKPRICAIWDNGATVFVTTDHAQRGDAHAVAEAWNALPELLRIVRDLRVERDRALAALGASKEET